ncbi:hypothetical protein C8J57DRAFT_1222834 [Mycena rebaudengoi]|nr:hypothetical protein C8J57DRAFT_1222834 [Mycena rebaudengoi]
MDIIGATGANFNYQASFPEIALARISISNIPKLTRATIGLAAYNLVTKTDYPDIATTQFSSINLQLLATPGTPFVTWSHVDDVVDGVTTTISNNNGANGIITIRYR